MYTAVGVRLVAVTLAILAAWAAPAGAGMTTTARVADDSIEAGVNSDPVSTGSSHRPISEETCTTKPINTRMEGIFRVDEFGAVTPLYDDVHIEDQGQWVRRSCFIGTRPTTEKMFWVPNVDATDLAKQALSSAPLPTPTIAISPTLPAITLVGYPQWLWIDKAAWKTVSASASAGGLTVTTTAVPTVVAWDSGDARAQGADRYLTCSDPGKPLPANIGYLERKAGSGCTFYYVHTSGHEPNLTFPLTATVRWHATWTATNGTSGDLGMVSRSSSIPIKVGEFQAVNITPAKGP